MNRVFSLLKRPLPGKIPLRRLLIAVPIALLILVILLQITVFTSDDDGSVVRLLPEKLTSNFKSFTKGQSSFRPGDQANSSLNIVEDIHMVHNPTNDTIEEEQGPWTSEPDTDKPDVEISDEELQDIMELPVYERLRKIFPYLESEELIEKNIIQSWKNTRVEELGQDGASWRTNNDFNYTLFDDNMIREFLKDNFEDTVPELIKTFDGFPRNILRYDFFRYIATFILGGTYADSDTLRAKPFTEWATYNKSVEPNRISAVVGLEGECDCIRWQGIFPRRVQFCQWTFQAKKHHPLLRWLISSIIENFEINYNETSKILNKSDQEFNFSDGSPTYYDGILEWTGPAAFTDAVFTYANSLKEPKIRNPNNQEATFARLRHPDPEDKKWSRKSAEVVNFGWEDVTEITEPILLDDLLILPKVYFNGDPEKNEETLVQHKYHGSWKSSNAN